MIVHEGRPRTDSLKAEMGNFLDIRRANGDSTDLRYIISLDYLDNDGVNDRLSHLENTLFTPGFERPAASIVTPVDIVREPLDNILRTLDALVPACKMIGPTEVIIWSDGFYDRDKGIPLSDYPALSAWENLCDILTPLYKGHDILRLRMPFNYRFNTHASFNHVRTRSMDPLIMNSFVRKFPPFHPFIWLDIDTPYISRYALDRLIKPLHNQEAHFTHANLLFANEANSNTLITRRTDAEKTAALYSLTRRMIERNLAPTDNRGYVDESGLAFTLRAFLRAGGVGTADPMIGESRSLLSRASELLDPSIPLVKYVSDAHIATSDRRLVQLAKVLPPIMLPQSEEGDDYISYSLMDLENSMNSSRLTTRAELEEMVNFMDNRQQNRTGHQLTVKQCRHLGQAMTRFGFI